MAEPGLRAKIGKVVLLEVSGQKLFAIVGAGRFITDGGIIEGDELDDARVIGVVTYFVGSV
ncbi:hypothetical protein GCM10009414_33960 [Tatumella terrea]|uniref:hypothetical protein n=1 Tax=Tatumella terrea TaxID=419007 RepID=UPI0031DFF4A2